MKHIDAQIGFPGVLYKDTKANVEALVGVVEGAQAYATDTDLPGWYNGGTWVWGGGSGITRNGNTTNHNLAVWNGNNADSLEDGGAVPVGGGDVATDPIWDAKGDLAGGTGPNTAVKLTVGADGLFLKAASGEATGLIWAATVAADGWVSASGTWTPRSQAFTNDPAAGSNVELGMADTSGFYVNDIVNVSSDAGNEDAIITVVHANVHITVATLTLNHTLVTPIVRLSSRLPYQNAYTNDPGAGANIELNMADTSGFAIGMLVDVLSSAGIEKATITVVHANTHITVNSLALNHTTSQPLVRIVTNQTFIIDTSGDLSTVIGVGNKIKFTDGTVKYFIVVAIAATRITLFGGTDYSIANVAAVTSPSYSMMRTPFGFPLSPAKWTVTNTDISHRLQGAPGVGTWYNLGTVAISIPIGLWNVRYATVGYAEITGHANAQFDVWITLSTANNSESDTEFTSFLLGDAQATASMAVGNTMNRDKTLNLTAKTPYYHNAKTTTYTDNIYILNAYVPSIIQAVCAYL